MKKGDWNSFGEFLYKAHQESLADKEKLMCELKKDKALYEHFWIVLKDFCCSALNSRRNREKIEKLYKCFTITEEMIETDCIIQIIDKLDRVLGIPIELQERYCTTICNNKVSDYERQYYRDRNKTLYLYDMIQNNQTDTNSGLTVADIIKDYTFDPEKMTFSNMCKNDLKERILQEASILAEHPNELLARLACVYLDLKPRESAEIMSNKGYEAAFAKIIYLVGLEYKVSSTQIYDIIAHSRSTKGNYKKDNGFDKLLSKDKQTVASQISRYNYRAQKRLLRQDVHNKMI